MRCLPLQVNLNAADADNGGDDTDVDPFSLQHRPLLNMKLKEGDEIVAPSCRHLRASPPTSASASDRMRPSPSVIAALTFDIIPRRPMQDRPNAVGARGGNPLWRQETGSA
jgi:hypothetical protein